MNQEMFDPTKYGVPTQIVADLPNRNKLEMRLIRIGTLATRVVWELSFGEYHEGPYNAADELDYPARGIEYIPFYEEHPQLSFAIAAALFHQRLISPDPSRALPIEFSIFD